ncbi:MAG TPA: radical SAM family heme chaperone HemW [Actinobacteria bacterium]|nr:radical SAM family heme chaperone HemW [Actinomycetota bacterium]
MVIKHLYVHLPFCRIRCDYCDFFSLAGRMELAPAYVDAVLAEAAAYGTDLDGLETIYLGGGTPTMLDNALLEKMLRRLVERASAGAEITVEANPVTIDTAKAQTLSAVGVSRVSLGVQSFEGRLRKNLGRSGGSGAVGTAVANLRQAGMDNIGLDLIFGIPGQSAQDLQRDLERALALEPEHISYYELTVKEGSPYQRRWRKELEETCDMGALFYEQVVDFLEREGFCWYETSNFARQGRECRHNIAYWEGQDFIGLGAGAWSTIGCLRWRNREDVLLYMDNNAALERKREEEVLSAGQKALELLMLGMRTDVGVSLAGMENYLNMYMLDKLSDNGFLSSTGERVVFTRKGRFMANEICVRLFNPEE